MKERCVTIPWKRSTMPVKALSIAIVDCYIGSARPTLKRSMIQLPRPSHKAGLCSTIWLPWQLSGYLHNFNTTHWNASDRHSRADFQLEMIVKRSSQVPFSTPCRILQPRRMHVRRTCTRVLGSIAHCSAEVYAKTPASAGVSPSLTFGKWARNGSKKLRLVPRGCSRVTLAGPPSLLGLDRIRLPL